MTGTIDTLMLAVAMPEPLAPLVIVGPVAILAMVVVSIHVWHLSAAEIPASRKRIRVTNGVLMMFTLPLLAYAVGVVRPVEQRAFILLWTLVTGLIVVILLLALIDALNNMRLHRAAVRDLRREIAAARLAELMAGGGGGGESGRTVSPEER